MSIHRWMDKDVVYIYNGMLLSHEKWKWNRSVSQPCPTICNSMDCSPPGSSVHGIFQARVLEWVATSFSRGSSWLRDRTWVSCIAGRHFYRLSHQGNSVIKKNEIMPFAAIWVKLEMIISEVSQKKKDKYHMISLICGIKNVIQMNLSVKQKHSHRHTEQICGCPDGWRVREGWIGSLWLVDATII